MATNIRGAHGLLAGRSEARALDYRIATRDATPRDLIYMDPPYQGTSRARDPRYYEQLDFDGFVEHLEDLLQRGVSFIISFDGRTGRKTYGRPLPEHLGLHHLELDAGRSSQSTLSGRSERTIESLYLSPDLKEPVAARGRRRAPARAPARSGTG